MLSEKVTELLKELVRSSTIPPYDDETIREIINEIVSTEEGIRETITNNKDTRGTPYISSNIVAQHATINRYKQCAMAYLVTRLEMIKEQRFELDAGIPDEILSNFSQKEGEFINNYDTLLSDYIKDVGIDITKDLHGPPRVLKIEVRVLKDCEIDVQEGPGPAKKQKLKANTTQFVRLNDVENLIRTGFLEHVTKT